ncbi:uncharacterized protein [Ptychodera flava]|uniref:uncharacterized protein n=1 Tax=Ptychodera flava TaxID=63121 RepID=UPI00396A8637
MSSKDKASQSTSDNERPAALVVCSYLGWPIFGGVAAAIWQLIYFLHAAGYAIYCTAFKVKNEDQNEFREFDVKVIYPDPPELYRLFKEDISWLHKHELCFPDIGKIQRVKVVFGFSMVTSYPAVAIRDTAFRDASFYLINPYKLDTPLGVLGYDEHQREVWKDLTMRDSKNAKAVFSVGSEIFEYFETYYQCLDTVVNHRSLKLAPADNLFKVKRPSIKPKSGNFQILMFVDDNDIEKLSHDSVVAKAMNHVAESFHNLSQEPPKWIIVSLSKGRENDIKNRLDPHSQLKIVYKSFKASEVITLLQQSHLALVPPSSINSINLSLSIIATGTPLLVPQYSPSHKTVIEYLPYLDQTDLAVDMKSSHTILGNKIIDVVNNYPAFLKRASEMRHKLHVKADEVARDMKVMLAELVCQGQGIEQADQSKVTSVALDNRPEVDDSQADVTPNTSPAILSADLDCQEKPREASARDENNGSNQSQSESHQGSKRRKVKSDGNTQGGKHGHESSNIVNSRGDDNGFPPESKNQFQHRQCHMVVRLGVRDGAPENDKPISEIEADLFRHASTQTNVHDYMDGLTSIHSDIRGQEVREGSLNFIVRCGSSDAADALWDAYSSGRLDRMADKTFLSIPILDDIGARMLSLETFIDYQEYLLCKQDIKETEAATGAPDVTLLSNQREILDRDVKHIKVKAITKQRHNTQRQTEKRRVYTTFIEEGKVLYDTGSKTLDEWLNLKVRSRHSSTIKQLEIRQKLDAQRDELERELALIKEKADAQKQKLGGQIEGVKKEISVMEEQSLTTKEMLSTKLDELTRELSLLEDSDVATRKTVTDQIGDVKKELTSHTDWFNDEMKRLSELQKKLTEDVSLVNERIAKTAEIDELILSLSQINQGIVPKDTVRRLSRQGNGPGEVWRPYGLTINQNEQVVVSDYGDDDDDDEQPGSVKTVTADTAQIISTITFHGLPNIFRPTDVKMSKNNLYYIADHGNKCILVCDAKSRLKQIIDIGDN